MENIESIVHKQPSAWQVVRSPLIFRSRYVKTGGLEQLIEGYQRELLSTQLSAGPVEPDQRSNLEAQQNRVTTKYKWIGVKQKAQMDGARNTDRGR